MKKTLILMITILSLACFAQNKEEKAKEHPKTKAAYLVNVNIDFAFKDKEGNDLLDSANDKHYAYKDIALCYEVKGKKIKIDKPRMDHPNDQFMYKDEETKTYHLRVFLEREVLFLQLNATTTDTIKCIIKKEKGSTKIEKVWYNGKLEWELGKSKSQVITITK